MHTASLSPRGLSTTAIMIVAVAWSLLAGDRSNAARRSRIEASPSADAAAVRTGEETEALSVRSAAYPFRRNQDPVDPAADAATAVEGKQIFLQRCARCHGAKNEGVAGEFEHPITGPLGLEELAGYIEHSMPADDPGSVTGEQARAVADWIRGTFLEERVRAATPRVELLRLDNEQFRRNVADLLRIVTGQEDRAPAERGGLKGSYRPTHELWKGEPALVRTDPAPAFDFAAGSPLPDTDPAEFSVVWQGSLWAPRSGLYRFAIESPNGFSLYLNDPRKPLIDGWVSTPESPRKEGTLYLLGGRWYPLRLEFFKRKDPLSSIRLLWQAPGRSEQIIPADFLSPETVPESLVVATPLPADDRMLGYERGSLVSPEWLQATRDAAEEVAAWTLVRFKDLAGVELQDPAAREKGLELCLRLQQAAWNSAPPAEGVAAAEAWFRDPEITVDTAVRRAILRIIQSPWFLYPGLPGPSGREHQLARKLGLHAFDGRPEPWVAEALAPAIGPDSPEEAEQPVREVATRLLATPAGQYKLRRFFERRFRLDEAGPLMKDPEGHPGFDEVLVDDLRHSLQLSLEELLAGERADYRQWFLTREVWMNRRMAGFYGVPFDPPVSSPPAREAPPAEPSAASSAGGSEASHSIADDAATEKAATEKAATEKAASSNPAATDAAGSHAAIGQADATAPDVFRKLAFEAEQRAGLLTHPLLLAQLSHFRTTSPIHRGVFVARDLMGIPLKPPPVAVEPLGQEFDPSLTTRQRVEFQTRPDNCMSCHRIINPFGFALERMDAAGRFRSEEAGKSIDDQVELAGATGESRAIRGPRELGEFLASRRETHRHLVESLFHHLVQQPVAAFGPDRLEQLTDRFLAQDCDIHGLAVEILVVATLHSTAPTDALPGAPGSASGETDDE